MARKSRKKVNKASESGREKLEKGQKAIESSRQKVEKRTKKFKKDKKVIALEPVPDVREKSKEQVECHSHLLLPKI